MRVVVCGVGILDNTTGLPTYVNVYDRITLVPSNLGKITPPGVFHVCATLKGKGSYQVALTWRDEAGASFLAADPTIVQIDGAQHLAVPQVCLPPHAGAFELMFEWRPASGLPEDAWKPCAGRAFLDIGELPEPAKAESSVAQA